ncbi:phage exclusion lipoprotein Cor [Enterobacter cloacae]
MGCVTVLTSRPRRKGSSSSTALIGGQENSVQIYGVRKQNNQTQYRAGYPFNWTWVSANTFTSTTCK